MPADPYDLQRFLDAQDPIFESVCAELRRGRKSGHWMWFVFPQIKGLGTSWMAEKFAITSEAEAKAYLEHPVLGARLIECTRLVNAIENSSAEDIFGHVDSLKFRSSMTLFSAVSPGAGVFEDALSKYFSGLPDGATLDKLSRFFNFR